MRFFSVCALAAALATNASSAFVPSSLSKPYVSGSPNLTGARLKASTTGPIQMSASAAVEAGGSQEPTSGGTASMSNEIFNLVKNIVGAGVLSLPAGIATFGNAPSAVLPAAALIAIIGGISGYCFSLIGRVCSYTGAKSYREAWAESIGPKTSWIAAGTCTFKTAMANLCYSMILADTFKALLATAGYTVSRSNTLFGITGIVLLPLCLMKNLSSLAPFSLLGIIGMVFTAGAMGVRLLSGAYKAPGGKFLPELAANLQPSFGTNGAAAVFNPSSFILICMLSTAYMSHFNAPKFYLELKDNTIKRYNTVVGTSFAVSISIFIAVAALGFLTFGANSNGLILNNYANTDMLMSASRIAVAISIVFSYPLAFVGLRDGLLDLANKPLEERSNDLLNKLTVGILAVITAAALKVKDLSFVLAFSGATLGNALIYMYPVFMFRAAVAKMGDQATKGLKSEAKASLFVAALGVVMGGIGAKMALSML